MKTLLLLLISAFTLAAAAGIDPTQPIKPTPVYDRTGKTAAALAVHDAQALPAFDRLLAISAAYATAKTQGETNLLDRHLARLQTEIGNVEAARAIVAKMEPNRGRNGTLARVEIYSGNTNAALALMRESLTSTNFFQRAKTNELVAAQKLRLANRANRLAKDAGEKAKIMPGGELGRLLALPKPDHVSAWGAKMTAAKAAGGTNYLHALRQWQQRLHK